MNGVLGVAHVVKFDKAVSMFDDDIPEFAVGFEEFFNVPLPAVAGQVAEENSGLSAHDFK